MEKSKKKLGIMAAMAVTLALIGAVAYAADSNTPYAVKILQNNADGDGGDWLRFLEVSGSDNTMIGTRSSDRTLRTYTAGAGISFAGDQISQLAPTQSTDTRSLNSCFQVDATHDASVTYSVTIAAVLSVTTGQKGSVFLESFTDSGCTTGTLVHSQNSNSNTGTLALGLNNTNEVTNTLTGRIPAGRYVKMRTVNDVGSPTFTFQSGIKEVF